uniref:Anoctamin n=1 Tax=Macrostomum lignano TaxID=282301 RepID=A0A1I8IHV5_9PLAT
AGAPAGVERFLPTPSPCTTTRRRRDRRSARQAGCGCRTGGGVVEDADTKSDNGGGDSRDGWRLNLDLRYQLSRSWTAAVASSLWRLIRLYFGERLAFYYAWFGYIIWCLLFLTAIGLCFLRVRTGQCIGKLQKFVHRVSEPALGGSTDPSVSTALSVYVVDLMQFILLTFENHLTIVFGCILTSLLTTEAWKRYESSLSYRWDVNHHYIAENRRPAYVLRKSRCQPIWCTQQTTRRKCIGFYSCVLSCVILVFAITVGFQVARLVGDRSYCTAETSAFSCFIVSTVLPITGQVIVISILDSLYSVLAKAVTKLGPSPFRFANNYAPLFYIAFVRQGRIKIGSFSDSCTLANATIDCFNLLNITTAGYMVGKSLLKSAVNAHGAALSGGLRGFLRACCPCIRMLGYSVELEILAELERNHMAKLGETRPSGKLAFAEQRHLVKSKEQEMLLDEYLEKVILYGFMTMFGSAFYLAPAVALIAMAIDLRLDSKRLLFLYRRPVPLPAPGIGVWNWLLDFLSFAGIFTTGAILAFTSQSLSIYGVATMDSNRLIFFIVFENAMLAIKFLLEYFYVKKILTDDKVEPGVLASLQKMQDKNRWYHALCPCCATITTPNPEAGPQLVVLVHLRIFDTLWRKRAAKNYKRWHPSMFGLTVICLRGSCQSQQCSLACLTALSRNGGSVLTATTVQPPPPTDACSTAVRMDRQEESQPRRHCLGDRHADQFSCPERRCVSKAEQCFGPKAKSRLPTARRLRGKSAVHPAGRPEHDLKKLQTLAPVNVWLDCHLPAWLVPKSTVLVGVLDGIKSQRWFSLTATTVQPPPQLTRVQLPFGWIDKKRAMRLKSGAVFRPKGQESPPHSKKTAREVCGASGRKTGARSVHAIDMPVKLLKIAHEDCMPVSEVAQALQLAEDHRLTVGAALVDALGESTSADDREKRRESGCSWPPGRGHTRTMKGSRLHTRAGMPAVAARGRAMRPVGVVAAAPSRGLQCHVAEAAQLVSHLGGVDQAVGTGNICLLHAVATDSREAESTKQPRSEARNWWQRAEQMKQLRIRAQRFLQTAGMAKRFFWKRSILTDRPDADYVLFYAKVRSFLEDGCCTLKHTCRRVFEKMATERGLTIEKYSMDFGGAAAPAAQNGSATRRRRGASKAAYRTFYWAFRASDAALMSEAEFVQLRLPLKDHAGNPMATGDRLVEHWGCGSACCSAEAADGDCDQEQPLDDKRHFITAPFVHSKRHMFFGGAATPLLEKPDAAAADGFEDGLEAKKAAPAGVSIALTEAQRIY